MTADTTEKATFDKQGETTDKQRVINAMHAFVREFGHTAAVHMESWARSRSSSAISTWRRP